MKKRPQLQALREMPFKKRVVMLRSYPLFITSTPHNTQWMNDEWINDNRDQMAFMSYLHHIKSTNTSGRQVPI